MYEIFITFAAMKTVLRNILFLAVALLYTMSTMGYGVHRCTQDGTASLILLFGETPCEWVHSHIDEHGNSYTHAHAPGEHHNCNGEHHSHDCGGEHSSNCCSTSVYTVSHDQNTTDDFHLSAPQPSVTDCLFQHVCMVVLRGTSSICRSSLAVAQQMAAQGELQALFCTFRA